MHKAKLLFLHLCRILGLFQLTRYLTRKKLQILCYHGFEYEDESRFRPKLFISRATFAQRLELLADYGLNVLDLGKALQGLENQSLPDNSLVLTIDDGFSSVPGIAADLLHASQYPATLYLTTYYMQKGTPVFRLAIQYLFWKSAVTSVSAGSFSWCDLPDIDLHDESQQQKLISACIDYGETACSEPQRVALCKELAEVLQVSYDELERSRKLSMLTAEEATDLRRKGVDIQLHTHRHILPTEKVGTVREISDNRTIIEPLTGQAVVHFCYPSGLWDQSQWGWLQELGVVSATTCCAGFNDNTTPMLALNRFLDGENISRIEFIAEITGFLEILRTIRRSIKQDL